MKNREIKFRAWDIDRETMIYDAVVLESNQIKQRASLYISKNVIWLQYTGLKDVNGIEIYEGDIIQDKFGAISKVLYVEDMAGFRDLSKIGYTLLIQISIINDNIKIIGNIYQNSQMYS